MQIKNIILIIMLLFFATLTSVAQNTPIKPVEIGEKMPEIMLNQVINYKKNTISASDRQGKLIILDFWATWCKWCIEEFPKDNSLQHKYGKKMQIILVNSQKTRDDKPKVEAFYKTWKSAHKDFSLPCVYMDTTLLAMFPHYIIPHYVWITPDGIVKAITDQTDMTETNIQLLLSGKQVNFHMKKDAIISGPFPGDK